MTEMAKGEPGKLLLYLPWEFDMLGGVDVVVERLWRGIENRFPGLASIGIQDWTHRGERTDDQGRRFLHLNLPAPPSAYGRLPARYMLTLLRRLIAARSDLKKHNITTVNIHFPTLNAYPLALLKYFGLWRGKIILSFHGSDVSTIVRDSLRWKTIANQTDKITACSAALAKRIDDLQLFAHKVQVIHNGIDCKEFQAHKDKSNVVDNTPYILNVGNYVSHKGQDVLLNAFATFSSKYPKLNLIFAGGTNNGEWLIHLKSKAKQLNISNRVLFLENQPQSAIASLMKNSICLVHTAHTEAFGLVLIEAGACGTAIIASRVGGIPEIIASQEFGLLFEDNDTNGLSRAIEHVLDHPDEAKNRAMRFRERVSYKFSAEKMVSDFYQLAEKTSTF